MIKKSIFVLVMSIALGGCGGGKLNPFSDDMNANADYQQYDCDQKQSFKLKMTKDQSAAWVLLDDHEVYLKKEPDAPEQYVSGQYILTKSAEKVELTGANGTQYLNCVMDAKQ